MYLIRGFQSSFGQGLYSGDELDSSLVKAKPAKVSGNPVEFFKARFSESLAVMPLLDNTLYLVANGFTSGYCIAW